MNAVAYIEVAVQEEGAAAGFLLAITARPVTVRHYPERLGMDAVVFEVTGPRDAVLSVLSHWQDDPLENIDLEEYSYREVRP